MNTKKTYAVANNFAADKQSLKPIRTQLNKDAGVIEKDVASKDWPFRITKGPDHPHVSPFFREVRIGQKFKQPPFDVLLVKINSTQVQNLESGVVGIVKPDRQVQPV